MKFKTLENIESATIEQLVEVPDVGEIVAKSVYDFFKDEKIINNIEELLNLGVKPYYEEEIIDENPFMGKTIVVTGSLNNYSRGEIKDKLQSLGAKVSSSVSKNTDYVLVGEKPGSKYEKAVELGVKVINEEEFSNKIK